MIRKPKPQPSLQTVTRPTTRPAPWLLLLDVAEAASLAPDVTPVEVRPVETDVLDDPDLRSAWPIEVLADALAPGVPSRDLRLSPSQLVRLDGSQLALADLVNGVTILRRALPPTNWVCLVLDREADVPVAGLMLPPVRAASANVPAPTTLREMAVPSGVSPVTFDLPGGAKVGAGLRQRVLARAASMGESGTTDPDLCLVTDGGLCHPETSGRSARFVLPPNTREVVLRTRWVVPKTFLGGEDQRHLGIAVSRIAFGRRIVPLDHWSLRDGWHPAEQSWRWTNGAARLLVPQGAREMEVTLANTLRLYPINA